MPVALPGRGRGASRSQLEASAVEPLVGVTRAGVIESWHAGAIAVVSGAGGIVAHAGDAETATFWRSTAALHRALALVHAGGVKRWELSEAQLAILCGSHHGEPAQVRCVAEILERIGLEESALHCGAQMPRSEWAAAELLRRNEKPSALHHPFSGNHVALLALSRLLGGDVERYEDASGAAQVSALEMTARLAGVAPQEMVVSGDGAKSGEYRTELWRLALAFARLIAVPRDWETRIHATAQAIVNAVTHHPDFISGAGEIDAEAMRAFDGTAICKLGEEGVGAAAWAPSERFPEGVGVAFKIADGVGGRRAIPVVLAAIAEQLELGTGEQRAALESHVVRTIETQRGEPVSELVPLFELTIEAREA